MTPAGDSEVATRARETGLRLRDGVITFAIAIAAEIALVLAAGLAFGDTTAEFYMIAYLAAAPALAVALVWPLAVRRCGRAGIGLTPVPRRWYAIAAALALLVIPAATGLALLMEAVFGISFTEINNRLYELDQLEGAALFVAGIGIVVVAPVAEELLFRGVVYGALRSRLGAAASIVVSAVLFTLLHFEPAVMPVILLFGLVFGWLRHRSGSALPGMVLHALNNAWSFAALLAGLGV